MTKQSLFEIRDITRARSGKSTFVGQMGSWLHIFLTWSLVENLSWYPCGYNLPLRKSWALSTTRFLKRACYSTWRRWGHDLIIEKCGRGQRGWNDWQGCGHSPSIWTRHVATECEGNLRDPCSHQTSCRGEFARWWYHHETNRFEGGCVEWFSYLRKRYAPFTRQLSRTSSSVGFRSSRQLHQTWIGCCLITSELQNNLTCEISHRWKHRKLKPLYN